MIDPSSRYFGIPTATHDDVNGERHAYLLRRFVPLTEAQSTVGEVVIRASDRLDLITARALHDPLRFWQLCDVNCIIDPWKFIPRPGYSLRVSGPHFPAMPK